MLITALLMVAKTWRQPKWPLTEDWIQNMWCIYTMEYHSAIRKDEILPFVTTWMDFETIVLSKISQSEKLRTVRGL